MNTTSYSEQLARIALEIGAIQINAENPFTWASGYRMPVYNDNRLLLARPEYRMLVAEGLRAIVQQEKIRVDTVAGTATAGIPHATTLANLLETPLIYVRSSAKQHGMKNQIEGILHPGHSVVMVEDVVSTGESVLKAVQAVREAGGQVEHCLSLFSYGFPQAEKAFQESGCRLHSLLEFPTLIEVAVRQGAVAPKQQSILEAWYRNPFAWGQAQGFPSP